MKPLRLGVIAAIATLQLLAADPASPPQDATTVVGQRGNSEANPQEPGKTQRLLNGRAWLALTPVEKNAQGDIMLRLRKDGKDPFRSNDSLISPSVRDRGRSKTIESW